MANDLRVDSGGLRVGAMSSCVIAAELAAEAAEAGGALLRGVLAMDAAVSAIRACQSTRVSDQADDMLAGALHFEVADEQSAGGLAELM